MDSSSGELFGQGSPATVQQSSVHWDQVEEEEGRGGHATQFDVHWLQAGSGVGCAALSDTVLAPVKVESQWGLDNKQLTSQAYASRYRVG